MTVKVGSILHLITNFVLDSIIKILQNVRHDITQLFENINTEICNYL